MEKKKYVLIVLLILSLAWISPGCGQLGLDESSPEVRITAEIKTVNEEIPLLALSEYEAEFTLRGPVESLEFFADVGTVYPASVDVENGRAVIPRLFTDVEASTVTIIGKSSTGKEFLAMAMDISKRDRSTYVDPVFYGGLYGEGIYLQKEGLWYYYSLAWIADATIEERSNVLDDLEADPGSMVLLFDKYALWRDYCDLFPYNQHLSAVIHDPAEVFDEVDAVLDVRAGKWIDPSTGEETFPPDDPLTITKVEAENGRVIVTFDKDVSQVPPGLVVYQDGVELVLDPDEFAVVDGGVEITVPLIEKEEEVQIIWYSVQLGDDDAVQADEAVVVGTVFQVIDLQATAYKTIEITFERPLDPSTVSRNRFQFLDKDNEALLINSVHLTNNRETVRLNLERSIDPQEMPYTVRIFSEVMSSDGASLEEEYYDLLVFNTEPQLDTVELVSATEIRVMFTNTVIYDETKILQVKGFQEDGNKGYVEASVEMESDQVALLTPKNEDELFISGLIEGDSTATLLDIPFDTFEDSWGNTNAEAFIIGVVDDEVLDNAPPEVVKVRFERGNIVIDFTEDLQKTEEEKDIIVEKIPYVSDGDEDRWSVSYNTLIIEKYQDDFTDGDMITIEAGTVMDADGNENELILATVVLVYPVWNIQQNIGYESLTSDVLDDAEDHDRIKLFEDVLLESDLSIYKMITLDLNGYTIHPVEDSRLILSASMTIEDGRVETGLGFLGDPVNLTLMNQVITSAVDTSSQEHLVTIAPDSTWILTDTVDTADDLILEGTGTITGDGTSFTDNGRVTVNGALLIEDLTFHGDLVIDSDAIFKGIDVEGVVDIQTDASPTFNGVILKNPMNIDLKEGTTLTIGEDGLTLDHVDLALVINHANVKITANSTIDGDGRVIVNEAGGELENLNLDVDLVVNNPITIKGGSLKEGTTVEVTTGGSIIFEESVENNGTILLTGGTIYGNENLLWPLSINAIPNEDETFTMEQLRFEEATPAVHGPVHLLTDDDPPVPTDAQDMGIYEIQISAMGGDPEVGDEISIAMDSEGVVTITVNDEGNTNSLDGTYTITVIHKATGAETTVDFTITGENVVTG